MFLSLASLAQNGKVLEEIVAVIGDNVVLRTDLETEYLQAKTEMEFFEGDLKCAILNELIIQKLYLHKGEIDSINVTADQVNQEVDRRIAYYASQIGGEANLEKYLGKTIAEYKEVMRPRIKDQLIIQQVQQQLIRDVTVSPTDVRKFYYDFPQDSLPHFDMEVELAQIVIEPEPNQYAKEYALESIIKIKQDILAGRIGFAQAAKLYSKDPGSAINGGELGYFGRGRMMPAFERAVFKLELDSISDIVETPYGYHIIQLIDRKGEKVNARHILIRPVIVESDFAAVREKLKDIVYKIRSDSAGINAALCKYASKYSTDDYTKDNCGFYTDPSTGAQQIPVTMLDRETLLLLRNMEEGQWSEPMLFEQYNGTKAYRVLYLRKVVPEHTANMKDDYQKIQNMALEKAQEKAIKDWVSSYRQGVHVWIDDKYRNCSELSDWQTATE
ncbi:hypothetical protein GYB22_09870 [bacterium]|nr:hypothetical protein [bacterium]